MKAVTSLLLVLILSHFCTAQDVWNTQTSNTTNQLNSVQFADKDNGWAVGFNGTILHTNSGGTSWQLQTSNTVKNLNAVFAATKDVGYIVGDSGVVLKTVDGGAHWLRISVPTNFALRSLHFQDATNGWIVGGGWQENGAAQWMGRIFSTKDGGNNWTLQIDTHYCFFAIEFVDHQNGYALGFDVADPMFYFTNNGGGTWNSSYFYYGIFPPYSMQFIDIEHGFITFESGSPQYPSSVLCTSDHGSHWEMKSSFGDSIRSLYFFDMYNGYVCGNHGSIYYTNDGGTFWTKQQINTDKDLKDMFFVDDSTGWIVGSNGAILRTSQPIPHSIPPPPKMGIQIGIWTDKSTYGRGDTVAMVITAYNPNADTVALSFPSACQASFTIDNFKFTNNIYCAATPSYRIIPPAGTVQWNFLKYPSGNSGWPPLELGPHAVTGEVLGYGTTDTLMVFVMPSTSVSSERRNANDFLLGQNYPNPFNGTTRIPFTLSAAGRAQLTLYNNLGQKVRALFDGYRSSGSYDVSAELDDLPSGLYWCRLNLGTRSQTIKLVLMK